MIRVTRTIVLDDREINERFVRAADPGGQNVNKVTTAVELRVDIPRSSLAARCERAADCTRRKACDDGWSGRSGEPGAPFTSAES